MDVLGEFILCKSTGQKVKAYMQLKKHTKWIVNRSIYTSHLLMSDEY